MYQRAIVLLIKPIVLWRSRCHHALSWLLKVPNNGQSQLTSKHIRYCSFRKDKINLICDTVPLFTIKLLIKLFIFKTLLHPQCSGLQMSSLQGFD